MKPNFGLPAELAELAEEYDFVGELGRGGSAIVYRARDRDLDREVAIKVVHPRPTSPNDDPVARLAREARTVAQLHYPGIVTVYAVRRLRSGGLALVMQLVPGVTLKELIQREGPLDASRTEEIIRDVARALAYAHTHRVIHRDVKPENIFLDAERGRALLADFGIARSSEAESHTMTGTAIGTPFYMSPEQVDGMAVDGRSDVYSLGLVAWEMLTGLRPWDGESLYHVIYKQKHEELPPIEAIRRDVPRRLQYIVERMLQKHPAARWAGADGLLVQLERSILPADYAQWQAGLPGRIARYRAVSNLQRPTAAKTQNAVDFGAATVRFVPSSLGVTTEREPAAPNVDPRPASPLPPPVDDAEDRQGAHEVHDDLPLELVPASATSQSDNSPAYDSVNPTWAYEYPEAVRPSRRPLVQRLAIVGTVGGVVVMSIAAFRARDGVPRLVPQPAAVLATLGTRFGTPSPARSDSHAVRSAASAAVVDSAEAASALVAVGAGHVCNVTLAGTTQCWGANGDGQLGAGSAGASARTLPQPVAGVMTYVRIAAGGSHTCGLTARGDVYCWGSNARGQLGDGTQVARSAPVRIGGDATFQDVRAGAVHTCGLDVNGAVWCWGDNADGQLGQSSGSASPLATRVLFPGGGRAVAIASGAYHSCAVSVSNRVYCWGRTAASQPGLDSTSSNSPPTEVPGVRATMIAAGDAHTCALLLSGNVRCWSLSDAADQGSTALLANTPGRLITIPGREDVSTLVAGSSHACALTRGGWIWCWTNDASGAASTPKRFGRGPYISVAARGGRTCAVSLGRVAECWPEMPYGRGRLRRLRPGSSQWVAAM